MNSSTDDRPEVLVLTHRDQLDTTRLAGKVIVVLDIIFATSSMITAFTHGLRECIPAPDASRARELGDGAADVILAGEKNAEVPDGFAHFAPLQLIKQPLADCTLIFCSTNGAPALTLAASGPHVYAGALLNRRVLCRQLLTRHAGQSVIFVCAGSAGGFCLEDFYGAGAFVCELQERGGDWSLTDSARAALAAYRHYDVAEAVVDSRVGRWMSNLSLDQDLHHCTQLDVVDVVPRMHGDRLLPEPPG